MSGWEPENKKVNWQSAQVWGDDRALARGLQTNYVENWMGSVQIPRVRSPSSLQILLPSEGSGCDDRIFQETNINYKRKKLTKLSQWREDQVGSLGERIQDVPSQWEARSSHLSCLPSLSFEPGLRSKGEMSVYQTSNSRWWCVRQMDGWDDWRGMGRFWFAYLWKLIK